MDYVYVLVGLTLLVIGGNVLVKGAVVTALKMKISTLVVGMTVVSFGTSAPELLVSVKAVLGGHPEISIGNVVGSNISNLGIVLGVTALIYPLHVSRNSIIIDWPMMMFASVLFYLLVQDNVLVRWEGSLFILVLITFIVWLINKSRKQEKLKLEHGIDKSTEEKSMSFYKALSYMLGGCVALYFGSEWLVEGAVNLAANFGVSEHVIGVSVVAFGTSVPELATSAIAASKKQTDISIGNLIGSNVFNILAILGITAVIQPVEILEKVMGFDVPWMLASSLIILPLMLFRRKIGRTEGTIVLLAYIAYIWIIFQKDYS